MFGTLAYPVGLDEIIRSDCVVAFGASLNERTTDNGALTKDKLVVQVDIDAAHLEMFEPAAVAAQADARVAAESMLDLLNSPGVELEGMRSSSEVARAADTPVADELPDTSGCGLVDVRSAMAHLDTVLPASRAVVTDGGRFVATAWRYLYADSPDLQFQMQDSGSIGLGIATAIGVALARKGSPTVAVVGDGGGMMGFIELVTAVRERVPLIVVVVNDGCYGAEYTKLSQHGLNPSHSLLEWPDLADVARSMGAHGVTIRAVEDIDALADTKWSQYETPLIIDVRADAAATYYEYSTPASPYRDPRGRSSTHCAGPQARRAGSSQDSAGGT